ncbi:MAG TPA: RHS repeat-associated core domain-containing protein, partial [Longimicrobium sp.]|nr:RHS repeat-associated core domain-containing protein [Longimicrobium sp.]
YDALGRRVMVRTNRADLCSSAQEPCTSSITRFVWSGDQIIRELRAPGGNDVSLETLAGTGERYGVVSYTHAGGIDRPLSIHKEGLPSIIPHQNWRGLFSNGTKPDGTLACPNTGDPSCVSVAWPGWQTTAWHAKPKSGAPQSSLWMGSLVDEKRDESGQLYMRNRYYDPKTGQFTQADPIGLAGGLNAYGFAQGDPVSYSDPYGLCPGSQAADAALQHYAEGANNSHGVRRALNVAGGLLSALWTSDSCISTALTLGGEAAVAAGGRALAATRARRSARLLRGGVFAHSRSIRILEQEGNHIIGAFEAARGEARFVTEMVREGDDLILRGTHIEGEATLRESLEAARSFGREQGATRVIIEGGVRTTGARPGHAPRTLVVETGL